MELLGCHHCLYGIAITEPERKYLSPRLSKAGLTDKPIIACTANWSSKDLIIQGYLETPVRHCDHFVQGSFHEVIPAKCQNCWTEGQIKVSRPVIGSIHLSCATYTGCKSSLINIVLSTKCKFCNSSLSLFLTLSGLMSVSCERCGRSAQAPLLFRGWPSLLKSEPCPHGHPFKSCSLCNESINKRINLIDLELPTVSEVWQGSLKGRMKELEAKSSLPVPGHPKINRHPQRPMSQRVNDRSERDTEGPEDDWWVSIHGVQAIRDEQREFDEELNEERGDYIGDSSRSEDNGWYYSDESNILD